MLSVWFTRLLLLNWALFALKDTISHTYNQGRRQEFFQGRALEGSPAIFQFSGGRGLNLDFLSLQWSK